MPFNGTEGADITVAAGAGYTAAFRASYPSNKKAYFVGKDHLARLLAQTDAKGIRIYFGENDVDNDGVLHIMPVLVAADTNENDILNLCVDTLIPCPNVCDNLNSSLLK